MQKTPSRASVTVPCWLRTKAVVFLVKAMIWVTNEKQQREKTKLKNVWVSCSALALFIQSPPNTGSSVRAEAHNAQGSGLSLAGRAAACLQTEMSLLETPSLWEHGLHTASSSPRAGKL